MISIQKTGPGRGGGASAGVGLGLAFRGVFNGDRRCGGVHRVRSRCALWAQVTGGVFLEAESWKSRRREYSCSFAQSGLPAGAVARGSEAMPAGGKDARPGGLVVSVSHLVGPFRSLLR